MTVGNATQKKSPGIPMNKKTREYHFTSQVNAPKISNSILARLKLYDRVEGSMDIQMCLRDMKDLDYG